VKSSGSREGQLSTRCTAPAWQHDAEHHFRPE
jgi:hypothetical protein